MKPETERHGGAPTSTGTTRRSRGSRLRLEITVVLCVKLLLLLLLRDVWFSHPTNKGLTERGVARALFGPVNGPVRGEERASDSGP
jgi:hypothetical protein